MRFLYTKITQIPTYVYILAALLSWVVAAGAATYPQAVAYLFFFAFTAIALSLICLFILRKKKYCQVNNAPANCCNANFSLQENTHQNPPQRKSVWKSYKNRTICPICISAKIFEFIFIFSLCASFVLISFSLQNKNSEHDSFDNLLSYGSTGNFIVVPSSLPKQKDDQIFLNAILKAKANDNPTVQRTQHLKIHILLIIPNAPSIPKIGAQIMVFGKLSKLPHGQRNAGILKSQKEITILQEPKKILAWVSDFRKSFLNAAAKLPPPGGNLLPGLVVGNESLIREEDSQNMKTASLSHLTAVSGSNIALIVGLVILICRFLGVRKLFRIIIAIFVLSLFILLVTPQGSVVRASAMAILVLLFEIFGKKILGLKVLCISIVLLLIFDAFYALDLGFTLSVAATFGLLYWAKPAFIWLAQFLPKWLAASISIPLVAQIACQPILILINPSISTYGILANILAAPAAAAATVIGLIAACLTFLLHATWLNFAGNTFLWLAWIFSHWVGSIANFIQYLPFNTIPWPSGLLGAGIFAIVCLSIYLICKPHKTKLAFILKCIIAGIFVLLTSIAGFSFTFQGFATNPNKPQNPRLIACDVGQGDSLLLRGYYNRADSDSIGKLESDRIILIDTGEHQDLLERCLQNFSISKIDLLILSHFDKDHSYLVGKLKIPIANAMLPDTQEARTVWQTRKLKEMGTHIYYAANGDSIGIADLNLNILSPWRSERTKTERKFLPSSAKGNQSSLTFIAKPKDTCTKSCISSLFLGDTGKNEQIRISAENKNMHVNIVKMAHHGSADQHPDLYKNIKARVAIISSGINNSYGHPRQKALDILYSSNTLFLRTDLQGSVGIWTEGESDNSNTIHAWTEKKGDKVKLEQPGNKRKHPNINKAKNHK